MHMYFFPATLKVESPVYFRFNSNKLESMHYLRVDTYLLHNFFPVATVLEQESASATKSKKRKRKGAEPSRSTTCKKKTGTEPSSAATSKINRGTESTQRNCHMCKRPMKGHKNAACPKNQEKNNSN